VAREWTDIAVEIEGQYPTTRGALTGGDPRLQLCVSRFANSFFKAFERMRRWSLAYKISNIVTTPNLAFYTIPAPYLTLSHVYWLTTTGAPVELSSYDAQELRTIYGEGANSIAAAPRFFAIEGTQIQLFPKPDDYGGANYTIFLEGQQSLAQMVETTGQIGAASTNLVVPSSDYLVDLGLATTGTYVSVRGSGNLGPVTAVPQAGTTLTNWTAFPDPTHVTLGTPAVTALVSGADGQVFFNSLNWLIQDFDLVILFGVLREIAAYLKENFSIWAQRLNDELDDLARFDVDRRKTLMQDATGITAQRLAQLARLDSRIFWGGIPNTAWF
jgi:hypothetical protein